MNETFFETIRCYDYEGFHIDYHKKRIARTIGSNFNLEEYIYPPSGELLKCKIIYNYDGVIDVQYSTYHPRKINSFSLVYDNNITYAKKLISREEINNLYATKKSADEIIIVKNGLITDTSIANIAIFHDEKWLTPKSPLLLGTTRERYIENNLLSEADITPEILSKSKKIALLNAMIDFDTIEQFTIQGV